MKFLLVLAVVLIGVWLWRWGRQDKEAARQKPPAAPPSPQEMVSCELCGLHFPKSDAVAGGNRLYCSVEHRQRAES